MTRILYYHPQSNFSRKIRILLAEKQIDYQLEEINLKDKPSYFLEISPLGKVPVFVDEDGTTIWDSTLIAEYIDEKYPQPHFYPSAPKKRLECRKWEELADTLGDHIINFWVLGLTNKEELTFYQLFLKNAIDRLLPILDQQLAKTEYLLEGETWTMADISALCSMGYYNFRIDNSWESLYKHLKNWFYKLHERNSVRLTVPEKIHN